MLAKTHMQKQANEQSPSTQKYMKQSQKANSYGNGSEASSQVNHDLVCEEHQKIAIYDL